MTLLLCHDRRAKEKALAKKATAGGDKKPNVNLGKDKDGSGDGTKDGVDADIDENDTADAAGRVSGSGARTELHGLSMYIDGIVGLACVVFQGLIVLPPDDADTVCALGDDGPLRCGEDGRLSPPLCPQALISSRDLSSPPRAGSPCSPTRERPRRSLARPPYAS